MATLPDPIPAASAEAHMVKVTNRNSFPFRDMFDGVPIEIMPGESKNIPLDMAAHFFAYPGDTDLMKSHTCRRNGWNTPTHILPQENGDILADKYFGNLIIRPVIFDIVERDERQAGGGIPIALGPDDDLERTPAGPAPAPIEDAFTTRAGRGARGRARPRAKPTRIEG